METTEQRRERRQRARTTGSGKDSEILPITESAATGQPESITVSGGDAETLPFRLNLRPPVISKAKALNAKLLTLFNDTFIAAAAGDETGTGINEAKAAEVLKRGFAQLAKDDPSIREVNDEQALELVRAQIREFSDELMEYDVTSPNPESKIEQIADCVWILTAGHNDGLTREKLPGVLLDNLNAPQFADLLRAILRAQRGSVTTYTNDIHSRF